MNTIQVPAKKESLEYLNELLQADMGAHQCPMKVQIQFAIAFEELFINIVNYAYETEEGEVTMSYDFGVENGSAYLFVQLVDRGIAYNPLEREDPDITLSAEEREPGGLGIFMAKKILDSIQYTRKDDCNCLSFKKEWPA